MKTTEMSPKGEACVPCDYGMCDRSGGSKGAKSISPRASAPPPKGNAGSAPRSLPKSSGGLRKKLSHPPSGPKVFYFILRYIFAKHTVGSPPRKVNAVREGNSGSVPDFSQLRRMPKMEDRIAFQWDAYCPLVDCISQHALLRGGGGVCSQGMVGLLPGGVPGPGGVVSQHALRQTPSRGQNS